MRRNTWCGANLADAEADEALRFLASTYDPERDRVIPGTRSPRAADLEFRSPAGAGAVPAERLGESAAQSRGERTSNAKVEIEFAVTLQERRGDRPRARLGFLQVRPMVVSDQLVDVTVEDLSDSRAIVASDMVMGNGTADDIQDIVFVRPGCFSPLHTPAMAEQLELINRELQATTPSISADRIRALGQFPSVARHSGRLEPDFRSPGNRRSDAAGDECGVEPGLPFFS